MTTGDLLGSVRVRATSVDAGVPIFIGVAPQAAVNRYLRGVGRLVITNWPADRSHVVAGVLQNGPARAPVDASFWTASASGVHTQTLTWRPTAGRWAVVVMSPSGRPGLSVTASIGATVPDLAWVAGGLIAVGIVFLAAGFALVVIPVVRASR